MNSKTIYPKIFSKKYNCTEELLIEAIENEDHHLWGACRDFGYEITKININWFWLSQRIDDFAILATRYMMGKLAKWSCNTSGSLQKVLHSIKDTVIWIMNRWVSVLKNLFDSRYSYHIPPSFLVAFDETSIAGKI